MDTQVRWVNLLMYELKNRYYTTKNNDILVPTYRNAKKPHCNHYIRII